MNILVTGGNGFIGKNIVEKMGDKYKILAPERQELDLLDEKQVSDFFVDHSIDVVIHSAVKPGHRNAPDLSRLCYSNTRMFFNIVRNSEHFRKVIFLSSGAVYDTRHSIEKITETSFDQWVPEDEHGFSKYLCAKYAEAFGKVIELRLFGVFGKYEDYAIRFISNAICKALCDMPITIKQNRKFDYLYIDDLMPVLEHFLQSEDTSGVFNVTPDESAELRGIAEMVRQISGKDLPIFCANPGMGPEYSGSNSRLRAEIPGLEFTQMKQAIYTLFTWYKQNIEKIEKSCLLYDR